MILGLGSDITDARRIAKVIERHGERFLARVFTEIERAKADRRKNRAETYAKRFAAKEACAKALGTGIRRGVWWRDMGVVNMPSGRPTMALTGGAQKRLDALTPKGHLAQIDLTITDEGPMAVAFVVISAVPRTGRAAAKIRPESRTKGRTKSRTKSGTAGRTKRRVRRLR
jgi:holo-[acyl-carrier protein] synthase